MSNLGFPGGSDFDKRWQEMNKRHDKTANLVGKGFAVFGIAWVIWACVCLAGAVGIVCVVWHFVSKFW